MLLVSKSCAAMEHLSWRAPVPGRLLHVRVHGSKRNIDLINAYQYTCHKYNKPCMEARQQWLGALNTLLNELPSRNLVYMAGDFNTSLQKPSAVVGIEHFMDDHGPALGTLHSDSNALHSTMLHHGLIALNTWHPRPPTFISHAASSRLDFILTRSYTADALSKDVKYLLQHPLYPWTGPRHCPILTTVGRNWIYNHRFVSQNWTLSKRKQILQHWKNQDLQ